MYKLRKVYICDHCGKVELPDVMLSPSGAYKVMPQGWGWVTKNEHLCPVCYEAYKGMKMGGRGIRDENA